MTKREERAARFGQAMADIKVTPPPGAPSAFVKFVQSLRGKKKRA